MMYINSSSCRKRDGIYWTGKTSKAGEKYNTERKRKGSYLAKVKGIVPSEREVWYR